MDVKEELKKYIETLLKIGFKKYELKIEKAYGKYYIVLPQNGIKIKTIYLLAKVFDGDDVIVYDPRVSKSTLSIRTNIPVK